MVATPKADISRPPVYLNYHPQLSLKTGLPLPVNTFDPDSPDEADGDIPGFGSKAALDSYTLGKGRKSVVPQSTYNAIVHTLLHPTLAPAHINPQHRYAFKHDPKYALAFLPASPPTDDRPARPASVVLLHAGRQVAVREQLYAVLAACHEEAGHGGRDKTGEVVRLYYSKVTKDVVQEFVRGCEGCRRRDGKKAVAVVVKKEALGASLTTREEIEHGVDELDDTEGAGYSGGSRGVAFEAPAVVKRSASDFDLAMTSALHAGRGRFQLPSTGDSLEPRGLPMLASYETDALQAEQATTPSEVPPATYDSAHYSDMLAEDTFDSDVKPATQVAFDMFSPGVSQEALDFVEGLTRSVRSVFLERPATPQQDKAADLLNTSSPAEIDASQTLISLAYSTGTSPVVRRLSFESPCPVGARRLQSSFTTPKVTRSVSQGSNAGIDWVALNAERERAIQVAAAQVALPAPAAVDPSVLGGSVATTLRARTQAKLPPLSLAPVDVPLNRQTMFGRCVSACVPMTQRTQSDQVRQPTRAAVMRHARSMSTLANFDGRGWEREGRIAEAEVAPPSSAESGAGWLWSLSQSQMRQQQDGLTSASSMTTGMTRGVSSATSAPSPFTPNSAPPVDVFTHTHFASALLPSPSFSFPTPMSAKLDALAARVGPPTDPQLQADLAFLDYLRTLAPDAGLAALQAYKASKLALPIQPAPAAMHTPTSACSLNLPWNLGAATPTFAPLSPSRQVYMRARTHSLSGNPLNPHGLSVSLTREEMGQPGYGAPCGARVEVDLEAEDAESVNLERRGSATEGQYAKDVALARGERKGPPGVRRVASSGVGMRFAPY